MTTKSEPERIEECAAQLVERFGHEALPEALLRADAARRGNDRLALDLWTLVADAIRRRTK